MLYELSMRAFRNMSLLLCVVGCSGGTAQDVAPRDAATETSTVPSDGGVDASEEGIAFRKTLSASYMGTTVPVIVDKPAGKVLDALVVYHGSVWFDAKVIESTNNILDNFKKILTRKDLLLVSVAYPEEGLLVGDNIKHAEAGLMWTMNDAARELGISIGRVFMAGHSQGGYLVTRLNGMHRTAGVVANGAGPLDLVYRCGLEESGQLPSGFYCDALRTAYGSTQANAAAYADRSLLNFTRGFQSRVLFVQGTEDTPIQMRSWPSFKQQVAACTDCAPSRVLDVPGAGHAALFESAEAATAFNAFLTSP